jgi:hypothetical protein
MSRRLDQALRGQGVQSGDRRRFASRGREADITLDHEHWIRKRRCDIVLLDERCYRQRIRSVGLYVHRKGSRLTIDPSRWNNRL